jgi:hypothetical protein
LVMQEDTPPDQPSPRAAGKHSTEANYGLTLTGGNP